jgi:hypothetical protein
LKSNEKNKGKIPLAIAIQLDLNHFDDLYLILDNYCYYTAHIFIQYLPGYALTRMPFFSTLSTSLPKEYLMEYLIALPMALWDKNFTNVLDWKHLSNEVVAMIDLSNIKYYPNRFFLLKALDSILAHENRFSKNVIKKILDLEKYVVHPEEEYIMNSIKNRCREEFTPFRIHREEDNLYNI